MDNRFTLSRYQGKEIEPFLNALAQLRITVFREYPYLYEGKLSYEKSYLQRYLNSPRSILIIAREDEKIIGASSGLPLEEEMDSIQKPFIEHNYDLNSVFYLRESVLLKPYREVGIGKQFFIERERAAKDQKNYQYLTFCAVVRVATDARQPEDYHDLSQLWHQQGFIKQPQLKTEFSWPEIGDSKETTKIMEFWLKKL